MLHVTKNKYSKIAKCNLGPPLRQTKWLPYGKYVINLHIFILNIVKKDMLFNMASFWQVKKYAKLIVEINIQLVLHAFA